MFQNFIGIDVSKDSFNYCIINNSGEKLTSGYCKMDKNGFDYFFKEIQPFEKPFIAVESTSTYQLNLVLAIVEKGLNIAVLNPTLVKHFIASKSLRKLKTDKVDAVGIAYFIKERHKSIRPFSFTNNPHLLTVARLRRKVAKEISSLKTSIKQVMNIAFPELLNKVNIFTKVMLNIIEKYPSAEAINSVSGQEFIDFFNNITKGIGGRLSFTAKDIIELAKYSIGKSDKMLNLTILLYLEQLKLLNKQLEEINNVLVDEVNKLFSKELEILTSIEGVGKVTASSFLAEIRDINRFENHHKLIAFVGTDPAISQSGNSLVRGKISKRGNSYLRRLAYVMAVGAIQHNKVFRDYFLRKRGENMPYKKAVIATANKLLRIIFYLLKKKETFMIPQQGY